MSTLSAGAHSTSTVASAAGTASTEGASSVPAAPAAPAAVTVPGGDALAMPEGLTKMEQMKVSASEKLPWQH